MLAGLDADTGGQPTALTISNSTVTTTGTHAILIGNGANGVILDNVRVLAAGDFGLVFKSSTGNEARNCRIQSETNAGAAAIRFKGAAATVDGCMVIGNGTKPCFMITKNDALTQSAPTVRGCLYVNSGTGQFYDWYDNDPVADAAALIDRNAYVVGGGGWGTFRGIAQSSLADWRATWVADGGSYMANDGRSMVAAISASDALAIANAAPTANIAMRRIIDGSSHLLMAG